jgi:N-acetylglutamate synthase-like GNAT family acetyltransferase
MDRPDLLILNDGTELAVRPIGSADKAALQAAFQRMSPESRYRRFFAPLKELSERDLAYLTEIDHHDHEALAAIEPATGIVGVARFVRTAEGLAEASIAVGDEWQHRGVGTGLLERLAARAREEGITHFVALVLAENRDAVELFERLGGTTRERTGGGNLELLIELPEPGRLEGSLLAEALREAARGVVTMNPWRVLVEAIRRTWHNRPGR